jgi:hypothetical protein
MNVNAIGSEPALLNRSLGSERNPYMTEWQPTGDFAHLPMVHLLRFAYDLV